MNTWVVMYKLAAWICHMRRGLTQLAGGVGGIDVEQSSIHMKDFIIFSTCSIRARAEVEIDLFAASFNKNIYIQTSAPSSIYIVCPPLTIRSGAILFTYRCTKLYRKRKFHRFNSLWPDVFLCVKREMWTVYLLLLNNFIDIKWGIMGEKGFSSPAAFFSRHHNKLRCSFLFRARFITICKK